MSHNEATRRFLTIFLPLATLFICIAVAFYYIDIETETALLKANEINGIDIEKKIIADNFKSIVTDLLILTDQHELQKLFKTGNKKALKELEENFLAFSKRKKMYDQIRLLDETGMEIGRVNFNNGSPSIVPRDKLQFKGNRYYFKDAFKLNKGEIFISPFDLNIEKGEIEKPIKPMIRFGAPVFDRNGKKRGILLLNYLGKNLIEDMKKLSTNIAGHVMLTNSEGYWLHSKWPENNWGFMHKDKKDRTFGRIYPEIWQKMLSAKSGQYMKRYEIFTFTTIYPLLEGWESSIGSGNAFAPSARALESKKYYWKIISHVPQEILNAKSRQSLGRLSIIYTVLFVLLAISSWSLARLSDKTIALRGRTLSPYNILITLTILVFLSEMFVMFLLNFMLELSPLVEALIDSTLLIILLSPSLYFFLLRPLILHISERKQVEEQREALIKNIHETNKELNDFAYVVSHDLKAPLRAISSLAGWIKNDCYKVLDDENRENLDLLVGRTKRMDNLISGILKYSRIGRAKHELTKLNSAIVVQNVIDSLHIPGSVSIRINGKLPELFYNETQLEQIFQNLINNAVTHIDKPEGEIVISCRNEDTFREFCVEDNGAGIEEKHFERIFKMFQSLKARDKVESTGIGLSLVKKIAEGHGGIVRVESTVGKGSRFFFTIKKGDNNET